jgi:hypothetical protein
MKRRGMRGCGAWLAALLVAACAVPSPALPDAERSVREDLGATLNVRVEGDSVRFELHFTNIAADTVVLEFPTAQRYDFEVRTGAGRVVWRWSDDHAHAQVMGQEVLAPGESGRYVAVQPLHELAGGEEAYGRLTSTSHPLELRTPVDLPAN